MGLKQPDSATEVDEDEKSIPTANFEVARDENARTKFTWARWKASRPRHVDPEDMSQQAESPLVRAGILSRASYTWTLPLLILGYRRPLDKADLNSLPASMSSNAWADAFESAVEQRWRDVEEHNAALPADADLHRWWQLSSKGRRRQFGILLAMFKDVHFIFWRYSAAIASKFSADCLSIFSTLVVKWIVNYAADRAVGNGPTVSAGVGAAIGLYLMLATSQWLVQRAMYLSGTCGIAARTALCASIHRRGMRMTNKARAAIPSSRLITHISADAGRVELVCAFMFLGVTGLVELVLISILLLVQLGYPALAGLAVMFCAVPIQRKVMQTVINGRRETVKHTDRRLKLTSEAISAIKTIKLFGWEESTLSEADRTRKAELQAVRKIQLVRAANASTAASIPVLATVVAFIVYTIVNSNDGRSASTIFSSLLLFNLLKVPLGNLPPVLGQIGETIVAMKRLAAVYQTETLQDLSLNVDEKAAYAVSIKSGSFIWDVEPPPEVAALQQKRKNKARRLQRKLVMQNIELKPIPIQPATEGLRDINLAVPRGQLIAIVGQVGSGKSSLVQALIGEMKRTSGEVQYGGSIAYSPQIAWLQSATIRENILFGSEYHESRYQAVVHAACLEADLEILPHGDLTEIGEKGVTLSGGQRQRVGIARCLYAAERDIMILDDPLSALDAQVGKQLFNRAICGLLKDKTRILVTNAIHVLPKCDIILVMHEGKIVERGPYDELMARNGYLSQLIAEFVTDNRGEEPEKPEISVEPKTTLKKIGKHRHMQEEERYRGAVGAQTWLGYIAAARGQILAPTLLLCVILQIASQVITAQSLLWWQSNSFGLKTASYLGLYGGLGASQSAFMMALTACNAFLGVRASTGLHKAALRRLIFAPLSFFESVPAGRILSRFSKDVDTIDSTLQDLMRNVYFSWVSIFAAVILIAVQEPFFLIAVAGIIGIDVAVVAFYRHTAREIKRLDNILRSSFLAHFSESLSGLSSIRAYGETERFVHTNAKLLDQQNCAAFMSWAVQRWLGFVLDQIATALVLIVALIVVCGDFDSSQAGLALSYIVGIVPVTSWALNFLCEAEVSFGSVERVLHYATELEQEASAVREPRPALSWPSAGGIRFENVEMRYKPTLPRILQSFSLEIRPGEALGICGRTGAGKSSILTALLRLVDISGGTILIDGVDISRLGLRDLRRAIAVLPQDAHLFAGTLRSNLDPFGEHDDARLNDALRRSHLNSKIVDGRTSVDSADETVRFTLDTEITTDGANLSIGQRSLVSLARALVKDARIVCLDEATASVDLATDEKIQQTIASEFTGRTIVAIAHRMKTLLSYDRVLVLDKGQVAELDTPAKLFAHGGIFKALCDESSLNARDIDSAQAARRLYDQ